MEQQQNRFSTAGNNLTAGWHGVIPENARKT